MSDAAIQPRRGVSLFSLLAIIVGGMIPILGVLYWGWDASQLIFLFWIETFVVGVFTYTRICDAERDKPGKRERFSSQFFALHYGIFWFVHGAVGVMLVVMFLPGEGLAGLWRSTFASLDFWLAVLGVCLMHAIVYWREWVRPQAWRGADPGPEMFRPYGRILAMHLLVTGGAVFVTTNSGPAVLVMVLCGIKLAWDLLLELISARFRIRLEPFG